jgi:hypothetical protein
MVIMSTITTTSINPRAQNFSLTQSRKEKATFLRLGVFA